MHELSIAIGIVEAACEAAAEHGGPQVSAVHLRLGKLSGVVKEALEFSYELACADTSLQGSRLIIEEVPVMVYCDRCRERVEVASLQYFRCPKCDAPVGDVVQGRELEVVGLEIED